MKPIFRFAVPVAASLVLVLSATELFAQATSAAESACMTAVNSKYGGRVNSLRIVNSSFSQANSEVIVEADGERWRCLSSNNGNVEELNLEQNRNNASGNSGGYHQGGRSGVTLFRDEKFRGASETFYGDIPNLGKTSIGNDSASSIQVSSDCRATLYKDKDYRGASVELYGDEPKIGRPGFGNDEASSIRVNCGGAGSPGGYQGQNSGAGGNSQANDDRFDTVCGVITNGQTYRYRCQATDHYKHGQKAETTLVFPDQTMQIQWHSGPEVTLILEGMKPQQARYSSSEGETDIYYQDMTYFYISDKNAARWEFQNFRE